MVRNEQYVVRFVFYLQNIGGSENCGHSVYIFFVVVHRLTQSILSSCSDLGLHRRGSYFSLKKEGRGARGYAVEK